MLGVPTTTPSYITMDVPVCMYVRKKFEGNARDVSNTMKHVLWVFYGFKNVTREYWLSGYLPRKEDRWLRSLESSTILKYE